MSANLNVRNGKVSFAFAGDRKKIWHGDGQQAAADWSLDQWIEGSGLDYEAILVPAYATMPDGTRVNHGYFNVHNKTAHVFAHVSQVFKNFQPREAAEFMLRYIEGDSRFTMSAMGALGNGERIWATAEFSDCTIAGESHKAYLLGSTAFDGSGATSIQATVIRGVCQNTVTAAMFDRSAVIKVRHSTKFVADTVARNLDAVVQSADKYRTMGNAMADITMRKDVVAKYFKRLLEIPFDAKPDDISSRKLNQYRDLGAAYVTTVQEGAPRETAWAALNAVTRYVDHDRGSRGGSSPEGARFLSANFGSGAEMKAEGIRVVAAGEGSGALFTGTFSPRARRPGGDLDVTRARGGPFKPRQGDSLATQRRAPPRRRPPQRR